MNEFLLDPMITTQNTSGLRFDDVVAAARAQAAAYRKMNTVNILADGGPTRPDYAAMAKVVTNRNKDKNFVQRALNPDKYPHLTDDKGNDVTHLMTWSDNGESMDIYPTVVYDNGKLKQLDDDEAFEYAIRNNERINIPISDFGDWYSQNGLIEHKEFAKGGGLSRSKDYGSKKKPYPSVKSDDFAGGDRSYPIPTKADAVDALRLAGLHHRADVKAKVYKKYPSLKHPDGGPLNQKPPKYKSPYELALTTYEQPIYSTQDNTRTNLYANQKQTADFQQTVKDEGWKDIDATKKEIKDYEKKYRDVKDESKPFFPLTPEQENTKHLADFYQLLYLANDADEYSKNKAIVRNYYQNRHSSNSLTDQIIRYINRKAPSVYNFFTGQTRNVNDIDNANARFSDVGADVIDLSHNVVRATPNSKQSNLLFNEFVETLHPSIYTAGDIKAGNVKYFGDAMIPMENISLYQGVEDGKFKVGSLDNFKDSTKIYPVRNIKKEYSSPITNINYSFSDSSLPLLTTISPAKLEQIKQIKHKVDNDDYLNVLATDKLLKEYEDKRDYWDELWDSTGLRSGSPLQDSTLKYNRLVINRLRKLEKDVRQDYYKVFGNEDNKGTITVTDLNGRTFPVSELNAAILDNKMLLGNPSGNSLFIGRFQDLSSNQLDSLNAFLQKNPSYVVRTDLGSFDQYRLDNPSLEDYLKQYYEHPKASDPNVYTVGTTTPNRRF